MFISSCINSLRLNHEGAKWQSRTKEIFMSLPQGGDVGLCPKSRALTCVPRDQPVLFKLNGRYRIYFLIKSIRKKM